MAVRSSKTTSFTSDLLSFVSNKPPDLSLNKVDIANNTKKEREMEYERETTINGPHQIKIEQK